MSAYKFALVKRNDINVNNYWVWMVETNEHFYFFMEHRRNLVETEYVAAKKLTHGGYHLNTSMQYAVHATLTMGVECGARKPNGTFVDDLIELQGKFIDPIIQLWANRKYPLAVNPKGGFCPMDPRLFTILKVVEKDELEMPAGSYDKSDIKITKWPGGKHYYAKVGTYDVVVKNEVKWDTWNEAEKNALEFLEKLNKNSDLNA